MTPPELKTRIAALTPEQRAKLAELIIIGGPRRNRLLAYVKWRPDASPVDPATLKQHLKERLPAHMIPATIIEVENIPRLPNGKIDRSKLTSPAPKAATQSSAPTSEAEAILLKTWQEVLGLEEISIHDDFFEIGGDSVLSIQIVSRARAAGLLLAPGDLADYSTIAGLATRAGAVSSGPQRGEVRASDRPIPLTPIQQWFFELNLAEPAHWNQAYEVDLDPRIDDAGLEKVVEALTRQHDQLRAGFRHADRDRGWVQQLADPIQLLPLDQVDADGVNLQRSFRFDGSPLVRFAVDRTQQRLRLIVVAHHLIVDAVSWQTLMEDLATACDCILESRPILLPERTVSFATWAERISEPDPDKLRSALHAWAAIPMERLGRLPVDHQSPLLVEADAQALHVDLGSESSTDLFLKAGKAYNTHVEDLLIAALATVMMTWTGKSTFRIGLERHGRDVVPGLDVSRTVGWFTTFFPVRLTLDGGADAGQIIKTIKEQLRAVPNSGLSYGQLRYSNDAGLRDQVASDEPGEDVLFNYLGRRPNQSVPAGGRVRATRALSSPARAAGNRRSHLLEINCWGEDNRLKMDWIYNTRAHETNTVTGWTNDYLSELRKLIGHCMSQASPGYTPSDFPEAEMSQEDLDEFLKHL
jgi:non-ribosomal peptide synthase protein (TIGR01720 family)